MSNIENPGRASLEGLASEIFKLVSRGATPEQWAEWLRVPLEHASADGNIDLFNALIGAGADGSAGWRGCDDRTLLDAAAEGGNAEVVTGLVAAGAQEDVNVVSASSGRSALYLATSLGHEDAARRLVLAGADVNFRGPGQDRDVLGEAVAGRYEELVTDLLGAGACPNTLNGKERKTPLSVAARSGSEGMVRALLARGVDKDALDKDGITPLMEAVVEGSLAVVNSLLAAGADVEIREDASWTALLMAAEDGRVGIINAILGHGADVDAVDEALGCSALHIAVFHNRVGAIEALVEAGADIELKGFDGLTPLGSATKLSFCQAMRTLLQHGASTDVQENNSQGDTLLHLACREQDDGVDMAVDLLLRSGTAETAVNNDGKTPLVLLESPPPLGYVENRPDIERARLLLSRAPADRAWRRRCWLVMLSSRASKARTASSDKVGGSEHGTDPARARRDGGPSNMLRDEHASNGESGLLGHADNGCVDAAGSADGGLKAVVESLIGLEVEGVFRMVVGFL